MECNIIKSVYNIGDYVKIIRMGYSYNTYGDWFDRYCPQLKEEYQRTCRVFSGRTNCKGVIVASGLHIRRPEKDGLLFAIKCEQDGVLKPGVHLIQEKGIELLKNRLVVKLI